MKRIVFALMLFWMAGGWVSSAQAGWVQLGASLNVDPNQNGQYCSITLTVTGVPYVAWSEPAGGISQIYVKHWNGFNWVQDGPSLNLNTLQNAYTPKIAILNSTIPYVTWRETNGSAGQIYVKTWNGTTWNQVGGSLNVNTANWGYAPYLGGFGNTPYVAFSEQNSLPIQVNVKSWNGTDWQQIGGTLNVNTTLQALNARIKIDGWGTPYVGWNENDGMVRQVYVKHWNGSDWQSDGGSLNLDPNALADRPDLVLDPGGFPYVTWYEYNGFDTQVRVKHWNGSSWAWLGTTVNGPSGGDYPGIALTSGGLPYEAYCQFNGVVLLLTGKHWNGATWVQDGNYLNVNTNQFAQNTSLALSGTDMPFVAWDETNGTKQQVYVKRYESPTSTPTPSPTATLSPTSTSTRTITPTSTITPTRTITPTATITLPNTPSPTRTRTGTRTLTLTRTISTTATAVVPSMTVTPNLSGGTLTIQTPVVRLSRGGSLRATLWLTRPQQVTLKVYDLQGKRLGTLIDGRMPQGTSEIVWDGGSAGSGVCYLYLETEDQKLRRKVVLVR